MNRNLIGLAVSASLAAPAIAAAPPAPRIFKLEGESPGTVRFLSAFHVRLEEGENTSWETILRVGKYYDPRYGDFEVTPTMLLSMVKNFEGNVFGQDILVDRNHNVNEGTHGKILKLRVEGNRLRALVEWTPLGVRTLQDWKYVYFSSEYADDFVDNEKKQRHGTTLVSAGITPRPVIKGMDRVKGPPTIQLSEAYAAGRRVAIHPELHTKLLQEIDTMWKDLIARLQKTLAETHKLAAADVKVLMDQATPAIEKVTDKAVAEVLVASMEAIGKQLAEARAAGAQGTINLSVAMPGGLSEEKVKELVEKTRLEQEKQVKLLAETTMARRKLLADTINAVTAIPEADRAELVKTVEDLVTADTSEDVVKRLAATQIAMGNKLVASRQLAALGYQPQGSVHIEVVGAGEITALQAEIDKRLGFADMPASERYKLSDGVQMVGNKKLIEKTLAMYDREHGRRLVAEYKQMKSLAAGDGIVSDVAVPASFERTVIREALYQLVGLGLCDVGTGQFAAVVQLPYSFRDTTAAGVSDARRYEGQAIKRAGVKQALEEARPIPQKLSFEVSDELRYLIGNGQINFDIVAENARNAIRIIGEDTERLVFDEHLRAADRQAVTEVVAEAVANGDGAKSIYILNQFPVVRPTKVYDLQGVQVGATVNPHSFTINAVNIVEYDFTGTQGAGTYYYVDYNLGEVHFVNQVGAPVNVTNTHPIVANYWYTTNVFKWDSDLGALKVDEKYDDFLYRFGLRKAVVEDRAYMANLGIMSGTLRTQIEQARQFGANFKRAGTDLMADGNLGRIKDVPSFRSYAPSLAIGDNRVVLCERSTVRFRMLKPWTMGQLENQKDANGRFMGKKEAYGDQFIVVHTPQELRKAFTSMVVYSAAARVDRA